MLLGALAVPAVAQTPGRGEPLAEVNGEAITAEEVEKTLVASLARLQEQLYSMGQG